MRGYNEYIGARYVPVFDGDWDNTKEYEPLVIVSYQGNSYTSKTFVPKQVAITDTNYWALTGNYNAQVEAYRQEVERLQNTVNSLDDNLPYIRVEDFGAKGDGTTDDTEAIQNAINYASENGITIILKAKTYKITDTLDIPSGTVLLGSTINESFSGDFGHSVINAVFPDAGISNLKPILNCCNDELTKYTNMSQATQSRTCIIIKNLTVNGGTFQHEAFCGIKMKGYDITVENVTITRCKIGIFQYFTFVTFIEKVNIFFCEIGMMAHAVHNNSMHRDLYISYGNRIRTNNTLSQIVQTTFASYLTTNYIRGIYGVNSKLIIQDSCIEEEYYAVFLEQSSVLNAQNFSIESITGIALADESNLGVNEVNVIGLHLWNPEEYASAKIAHCDYRSKYILKSYSNKPEYFENATMATRGMLIVHFNDYDYYPEISISNMVDPIITLNRTHFDESGDLIIDFILDDYTSVDLSQQTIIVVGSLSSDGYPETPYLPIVGTEFRYNPVSQGLSKNDGTGFAALTKKQRYYFRVPYMPN